MEPWWTRWCEGVLKTNSNQAGIFFTHPEQLEILGIFLNEAAGAVRRHEVDVEEFSAMLRAFGGYDRARDVYLEEYFPLADLIRRAAAVYRGDRSFGIPDLAEANAKRLLRFFFQKHVLEVRSVFAVLIDQLLRQAVAEGCSAEQGASPRNRANSEADLQDRASVLQRAHRSMNLEGRALTLPLLKSQYKRLMKIGCTGCRYCMPCPSGVDIPACFEIHNNLHLFGEKSVAKVLYLLRLGGLESSGTPAYASLCENCGACEEVCPQNLPIQALLRDAVGDFEGRGSKFLGRAVNLFMGIVRWRAFRRARRVESRRT